ncbi:MAG: Asp-tRNA(Asn)/Glu-tRNA(Gln) amidotransferase subunit GatA [Oscillospiraceae bacterium]|nr:Asp-tRNA(Asn)/Glu-tRNA(Gln) amidotransferase subunit GatA [Oscillospiraceae bacterium]
MSLNNNLNNLTATKLSKMLRNKECSAVEISKDVFKTINNIEKDINAYITITEEDALKKAREVDEKISKGEALSPLAGIPIGIKDNICLKGVKTTCGSKILSNFVSPYDATVVERLKNNDVVFTGKLNLDEFAMGSSGEYSYFGKTKNPINLEYVPGGSSSGPVAAVAAGEAIMSLGSDTGGSIRVPAAFCGLVGLKPTYGAVSRYGLVALASSLDHIGPIAKTVDDTAMLYRAICGFDQKDATSSSIDHKINEDINNFNIKGLRIGVSQKYFGNGVDKEVVDNVKKSIKMFEDQGAIIKEVELPSGEDALAAYHIMLPAEASSNLARFDGVKYGFRAKEYNNLEEMYENTRGEGFGQEVKRRIILGTFILSAQSDSSIYAKGRFFQKKIISQMKKVFEQCDIVITPSAPSTAFKFDNMTNDPVKMYMNDMCTVFVNIAGLPAISLPCGTGQNGLPIGLQIIGPHFSENLIFKVSKLHENFILNI